MNDYVNNNNIFVYISNFGISGFTPVNTDDNGVGTVVINNFNNSNVTFKGQSFRGVVISGNGFDTAMNPAITFTSVEEFIDDPELAPFQ